MSNKTLTPEDIKTIYHKSFQNIKKDDHKKAIAAVAAKSENELMKIYSLYGFGYSCALMDVIEYLGFSKEEIKETIEYLRERQYNNG